MAHYHRPRWGAISLGCLCATGAGAILLQDIKHTGAVTVDHGLSVVVLVGTIAAGHMAAGEARQLRPVRAVVLALIFALGSAWCIGSTAGRQADGQMQARAAVADANRLLVLKGQELDAARKRLAVATAEVERECRTGFGRVCAGWQATERERQAHVAALVADIGRLGPTRVGDQKLTSAAAVAALLTGAEAGRVEAVLVVLWPFVPALFLELGSIVFFGIGLPRAGRGLATVAGELPGGAAGSRGEVPWPGAGAEIARRKPLPASLARLQTARAADLVTAGPEVAERVPTSVAARHPVLVALESRGGAVASNAELAAIMGVTEGESSKRVAEVAADLVVERVGREKRIRLR